MEQDNALDLYQKVADLQRGRFVQNQHRREPLYEVRMDATVTECEGWPIRNWRVRIAPSRKLDSALTVHDIQEILDCAKQLRGWGDIEVRMENSALELS